MKGSMQIIPRGGGHSGTKWLPTAIRPHVLEAVTAKI